MTRTPTIAPPASRLFSAYKSRPGVYDELVAADGKMRPQWAAFAQHLDEIGAEELDRRWQQSQRQIQNDGVTFNPHDDKGDTSRPWVLDAVPLLLAKDEWQKLSVGLEQRARLFDLILRDLYGPQLLIKDKILPPDLLFGHPGFYPAYHGLGLPEQRHLHLYAADLARAPDGGWWVISDRTRAPFGLGYVLENRVVTSRMLPGAFRNCRVERLAPFFITLRETLRELAPRFRDNPRIVLWSKGPTSRSYFEDAFLARYLGYTLVEGGDLAVRENRVMLKTLGGLLPVEVLFRRLDDDDVDPVELRPDSTVGVSGLLEVLRAGNVAMANALGSRLVESSMLLAFLPLVCEHLLGEELILPSVATWWCAHPEAKKYVFEHLDELLIRPAHRMGDDQPIYPPALSKAARESLVAQLKSRPERFVAQETVRRSTAPVWRTEGPAAWYLALRAFLVARGDGYESLPGGLARVSQQSSVLDYSMTSGEQSQDVWILSDSAIEEVSLLAPAGQSVTLARGGAELPSRVADNLFWMGRQVERAEGLARLLRTVFIRMTSESEHAPELPALLRPLAEMGQIEPDYVVAGLKDPLPDIEIVLPEAIFNVAQTRSLRATINELVRLASIVRDRIAVDAWHIIHRIDESSRRPEGQAHVDATEVLTMLNDVITELVSFAGLASESMTRTLGWRFLDLGRRIERAWQTSLLIRSTLGMNDPQERLVLEALLQTADSIMTYRSRYLATVQTAPVLDLLLTDETNPRSVGYQLVAITDHVDKLPRSDQQAVRGPEQRLALSMLNSVRLADVFELSQVGTSGDRGALQRLLTRLCEQLPKLSDAISNRFLIHAGLPRQLTSGGGPAR